MTGVDVAALRKLHEAATPGPWERFGVSINPRAQHQGSGPERAAKSASFATAYRSDAAFIAALRNAAPALLDAAEALQRVQWVHRVGPGGLCIECGIYACNTMAAVRGNAP